MWNGFFFSAPQLKRAPLGGITSIHIRQGGFHAPRQTRWHQPHSRSARYDRIARATTPQTRRPDTRRGAHVVTRALVGTVVAFEADSLMVQRGTDTWRLSLASLTRLEMSQGRRSHAGLGAGIGLLVGAGVGAVIGSGCDLTVVPVSSEAGCIAVGVALVGGAGALLGAVIGSHTRTERWAEVPLDHLRISFMPRRSGRVQFTASISL